MYMDDDAISKLDTLKRYLKDKGQNGASRSDAIRFLWDLVGKDQGTRDNVRNYINKQR